MRTDLPSGTVTFLFTDVEGSTRLLHELGAEGYAEALAEHRRVIREACAAGAGVEVDTQGDAFFFAFPTAPGALSAATELTEALTAGTIRVRVGLHTGTPLVTDEGYVGADVHRAARIAASGAGGQVLVSASTATLLHTDLRDLGEHRFKDLAAAERVFQLGAGDFPPLRSLYRANLPVPATPFLGREHELAEVVALLDGDDVRLLTLTGAGGTGKTRLALQAAAEISERFPDGIWWVPLASLRDPALVPAAIAHAVGVEDATPSGLADSLRDRRSLVLLDNLEHLLPAIAGDVATLRALGGPTILVTSRERLQLAGEHVYPVASLDDADGAALFAARAHALDPTFAPSDAVAELCARLDGLPLAIELAAARTSLFTVEQLLERLAARLDLLKGGRDADPRQQTLRAAIEWSYDLLDADEQRLFALLSVFVGGCSFEMAEDIVGADPDRLQSLIDKSLVRRRDTALGPRYWMLETIREYAAERFAAAGEADAVSRAHAEAYLRLATSLGLTMENLDVVGRQRHDVAIAEQDNFRAAIDWAGEHDLPLAVRIGFALENFWVTHDPYEGKRRFEALANRLDDLPPELRAPVLRVLGNTTMFVATTEEGLAFYAAARDEYLRSGNERGAALMEQRMRVRTEDPEEARRLLEDSIRTLRRLGLRSGEVQALGSLAWVERRSGHPERALELMHDSAELAHAVGFAWTERELREGVALLELELGRPEAAEEPARTALELARRTGDSLSTLSLLALLARVAAERGQAERAGKLWGALEAEEARSQWSHRRGPYGAWKKVTVDAILAQAGPELDRGLLEGRRMSLDEAVEHAFAS